MTWEVTSLYFFITFKNIIMSILKYIKNNVLDCLWVIFPKAMNEVTYNNLSKIGQVLLILFIIIPLVAVISMCIIYTALVLIPYLLA
jgi:hypothetical protein